MNGFTMQTVREHKTWSDVELFAYRKAAERYSEAVKSFEKTPIKDKKRVTHDGLPNFQKLFREELASAQKVSKRAKAATIAAPTT